MIRTDRSWRSSKSWQAVMTDVDGFRRPDKPRNFACGLLSRYLKGQYKSESLLMAFEAELHGWVSRMARPVVTLIGSCVLVRKQVIVNIIVPLDHLSETR